MNEIELTISPDFTIEDIHKIREWNYERSQTMTAEQIKQERQKSVSWFENEIRKRRNNQTKQMN